MTIETTHRVEREHGPPIIDGVVRWFSPSMVAKGDPESYGGCLRRLFYHYVVGPREPTSAAAEVGTAMHGEIEHYLTTGKKVLGTLALAGARYIPEPGPDLMVEQPIGDGLLTLAGIPVRGHADLIHQRGASVRDDGELIVDPAGTVLVEDWKSTGSKPRFESATTKSVAEATPMLLYGEWAARRFQPDWLRLSHTYFLTSTRPRARRVSALVRRDDIARRIPRIEGVARSIVQAAACTSPEQVDGNLRACEAFRGCTYREVCSVGRKSTLDSIFGPVAAASLIRRVGEKFEDTERGERMSLIKGLNLPSNNEAPTQPAAVAAKLSVAENVAALKAEMAAAEAARARPAPPAWLPHAAAAIAKSGMGAPTVRGELARALGITDVEFVKGSGQLGDYLDLSTLEEYKQLATELGWKETPVATPAPAAPSTSAPAIAAGILPPDAPGSDPAKATAGPPPAGPDPAIAAVTAERPKRGRPKKTAASVDVTPLADEPVVASETVPAAAPVVDGAAPSSPATLPPATDSQPAPGAASGIFLFVDCLPSTPFVMLDKYVAAYAQTVCEVYGLADVRVADDKSPVAFGKWRGAVAALVRERPVPPGAYVILRRSELDEVVAETLSDLAEVSVQGCPR